MSTPATTLRIESSDSAGWTAASTPRLSWTTVTDTPDWVQARAEIDAGGEVATVEGDSSVLVAWPFAPRSAHEETRVRVRVTGSDGIVGAWSTPVTLRSAFLEDGEWRAKYIEAPRPVRDAQPARLRTEFEVSGELRRATLYAAALGVYQVRINGRPVDDHLFKPGWTPYSDRVIHETTDVTDLVADGVNAIGIDLAGGWYTEHWFLPQARYGAQPAAAAQIRLEYVDGTVDVVATDATWRSSVDVPLLTSSLYDGDHVDGRRETEGWDLPGFADGSWQPVRYAAAQPAPTPRIAPPVRVTQTIAVAEVLTSPSGTTILDFGQNLVGRLRIEFHGKAGDRVVIRHAEVLEHGELGVRPLRGAAATDSYTLRGDPEGETWEPPFTFHGFRYAELTGDHHSIRPEDVMAVVIGSDLTRTGWFSSSHALLNKLHENVVWGMRGNFLSVPTDCPQRDERLGWTGDIQVFSPTASFLFDTDAFLTSWLEDLRIEQAKAGGSVPFVVPNVIDDAITPAAAWGDAATVVPTVLHERYGDKAVLEHQFMSMRDWTDHVLGLLSPNGLWDEGFQFGDWLDPTAPPEDAFKAMTEPGLVATAYVVRSATLTSQAAVLLGESREAERFAAAARAVRESFRRAYVDEQTGLMSSDSQTAYALALAFDIVTEPHVRELLGERLAALVAANGHRIGTGFVGTPLIADALTATGHFSTASALLFETSNPSWLYPVTMGATTIWERWDSMLEDGSINPGEMTSFNHYALGAVADWMHRTIAGIAPAEPGYRTVRIAPRFPLQLEHAGARHDGPYGPIIVDWRRDGERIHVTATVPPNSRARVELPGIDEHVVGSGSHQWVVTADNADEPQL